MSRQHQFRIEDIIWTKFRSKYPKTASQRLRNMVKSDLDDQCPPQLNRDNIEGIKTFIFTDDSPVQVIGNVGIGKSEVIKKIIASDNNRIFIVFDVHGEYSELPAIQGISDDIKQSSRIVMPEQISASKGLFPVYHNQILSHRHPKNYVIVIEEAHRYRETKELLKEARKFCKVITVSQASLGSFCHVIKIVGGN